MLKLSWDEKQQLIRINLSLIHRKILESRSSLHYIAATLDFIEAKTRWQRSKAGGRLGGLAGKLHRRYKNENYFS